MSDRKRIAQLERDVERGWLFEQINGAALLARLDRISTQTEDA